jgi:Domain of unknown function (DUF4178)
MNFGNPTQITLGMTGELYGVKYRVLGRVLLGEKEEDIIYAWNEFNMVADTGETATLVFEETSCGPEWRWFTMFDPEFELPAEDAATKKVGDRINLDGTDLTVTLVQESRIYSIEGRAPEGQSVGSRANYFNAEAGSKMIVVSWTGREMEYYRGVTIGSGMVASAFNLKTSQLLRLSLSSGGGLAGWNFAKLVTIVLLAGLFFMFIGRYSVSGDRRPAVVRFPAPASPLLVGGTGSLNGTNYHLIERAQVEIEETGLFVSRQEYYLKDDDGHDALLVLGLKPNSKDWFLFTPIQLGLRPNSTNGSSFTPIQPLNTLTPQEAGGARIGQAAVFEGTNVPIGELFRSSVQQVEAAGVSNVVPGVSYGFAASANGSILMARWDENGLTSYEGRPIDAKEVLAAFGKPPSK